jgi:hypothetical protein
VLEVYLLVGELRLVLLAVRRLTLLEEFLFMSSEVLRMEDLLELLPYLHIIGSRLEAPKFTDYDEYCEHNEVRHMCLEIGNSLSLIRAPACTLQLRQLALVDIDQVLDKISLPELQVLELSGEIAMHPWLVDGSPKLTELYIYKMHQATLMPALGHIGQQLQVLILDLLDLPRLDLVLEACPNLNELHIRTFNGVGYKSQLQADTLKHLQIAEFYVSRGNFDSELLMQILRLASKLRSIEVHSIKFDADDWETLAEQAKEGTCMQHLETIKITKPISLRSSTQHEQDTEVAKARANFSVICPKLQVFNCEFLKPRRVDPNSQCPYQ